MIVPMKKAILVLRERDKASALRALRRLGVVHADPISGRGESWEAASSIKGRLEQAIGILLSYKTKVEAPPLDASASLMLADRVLEASGAVKENYEKISSLRKEIERVQGWGEFDPAQIEYLRGKGLDIRFYSIPAKSVEKLPSELPVLRLGETKGIVRLAAFPREEQDLPPDAEEFSPAQAALSELRAREAALIKANAGLDAEMAKAAEARSSLEKALRRAETDLTFETILTGMEVEGPVAWVAGWVPEKDAPRLSDAAAKQGWGLLLDDPADDELPPTKVENNALVRIVAPIFDFLGTVPNYREYDISGSFLFFFTFFFAMIYGDGGYGSLMLLGGLFAAWKTKKSGGKVPDPVRLLLLLAAATVGWGVVTGTWFGLPTESLPAVLRGFTVRWIANDNPMSGANVKQLCFILGGVQLIWAHLKNLKRDRLSLKLLAQIGLLMQVMGIYFLVLNLVLDSVRFPLPGFAMYLIGIGFALNFVFANYEGNILKSILASLANIVSVLLGVVNVFADITSYIRLWAVGLAGLAISQTVNMMAGPMLGKALLFVFGLALIFIGHGLNVILSLLSVIVHGVRLNMLEYSSHLGMEWSGFKYEPFREVAKEEASV